MLTSTRAAARGAALVEILVSIVITVFGLLALAGLQTRMNGAMFESQQRSHAVTLLQDLQARIQANLNQSASYVTAAPVGTGDTAPDDCTTLAGGTRAAQDLCEWSNALKGASEVQGTSQVGGMIGARGCVEQLQAANPASGICQPATYRLTVVWQGMNATVAPASECGADEYGPDDRLRKAISAQLVVPLPACS